MLSWSAIASRGSLLCARVASGFCLILILAFSLLPQQERLSTGLSGKSEHFLAYSLTGLLLGLAIRGKWGPRFAAALLFGLASTLEILQGWSPGRHPRFSDAVVSAFAAFLGAAIAAWLRKPA